MNKIIKKCVDVSKSMIHLPVGPKKHFSFIIYKNKILSFGVNNGFKTHPLANKLGYRYSGIHSELAAILNFEHKNLDKCYILNIRIGRDGELKNSKPCVNCSKLIKMFFIKRVIYFENSNFLELLL